MGGFSIWHWLILIIGLLWAVPTGIILKRLGYSSMLGILMIIPLVNFIAIWALAFARWPIDSGSSAMAETFE